MGGPLRPGPGGGSSCSAGSGGAGRHREELHLPGAEAGEEDCRLALELVCFGSAGSPSGFQRFSAFRRTLDPNKFMDKERAVLVEA